jgi:hypothetical protein
VLSLNLLAKKLGFGCEDNLADYIEFIEPTIAAIQSIQDTPTHQWIIWISGGPVTGKTTLAKLLIEEGTLLDSQLTSTKGITSLLCKQPPVGIDDYKERDSLNAVLRAATHLTRHEKRTPESGNNPNEFRCRRIVVSSESLPKDAATASRCILVEMTKDQHFAVKVTPPSRVGEV